MPIVSYTIRKIRSSWRKSGRSHQLTPHCTWLDCHVSAQEGLASFACAVRVNDRSVKRNCEIRRSEMDRVSDCHWRQHISGMSFSHSKWPCTGTFTVSSYLICISNSSCRMLVIDCNMIRGIGLRGSRWLIHLAVQKFGISHSFNELHLYQTTFH